MVRAGSPWEELLATGRVLAVRPGRVIHRQGEAGEAFYYIRSGRVKATLLEADGTEKILDILGPGDTFGETGAFGEQVYLSTAVALEPCELVRCATPAVMGAIAREPELARALIRSILAKERNLGRQVQALAFLDAPRRVASVVHALAAKGGDQVHLTHEQLAGLAGTSRVTVSKTLAALGRAGIIEQRHRGLVVRDRQALGVQAAAGGRRHGRHLI